jgi:hypothetical protein
MSTRPSEKKVNADDECAGAQLDKGAEGRVDERQAERGAPPSASSFRISLRNFRVLPVESPGPLIGIDNRMHQLHFDFLTRPRNRPWNGLAR